jgi:hypothetical protein
MIAPRIIQDPAEGSRETVEHELDRQARKRDSNPSPQATSEDVKRILRTIDGRNVVEILDLRPTVAEIEQAALWSSGEGGTLGKAGFKLSGRTARIFEIVSAGEDEDEI